MSLWYRFIGLLIALAIFCPEVARAEDTIPDGILLMGPEQSCDSTQNQSGETTIRQACCCKASPIQKSLQKSSFLFFAKKKMAVLPLLIRVVVNQDQVSPKDNVLPALRARPPPTATTLHQQSILIIV